MKKALFSILMLIFLFSNPNPSNSASYGIKYTYDAIGRIASVIRDNGQCTYYTYDLSGNMLSSTNENKLAIISVEPSDGEINVPVNKITQVSHPENPN